MLIPKFETGPTEYLPFERIAFLPCTFVKIFILIGYGGFCKNTNVLTSESIMKWDLKKKNENNQTFDDFANIYTKPKQLCH